MARASNRFPNLLEAGGLAAPESLVRADDYELWRARAPNAFGGTELHILHLRSSAGLSTAEAARKIVPKRAPCYAVCENSCHAILREPGAAALFGVDQLVSCSKFLLDALRQTDPTVTAAPIAEGKAYVDPQLRVSGDDHSAPRFLSQWLATPRDRATNGVGVLLADAGMGKTTIARRIYRDVLAAHGERFICLKLESDDWRSVSADFTLWDVLLSATTRQQLPISLQKTFRTSVQEHLLLIVLDGFDELCSTSKGTSVEEGVRDLLDMLGDGAGKVLITSRKGYWESNVTPDTRKLCDEFELLPFDKQQLSQYFEKRFPKDFGARDRARDAAAKLRLQLYGSERQPPVSGRPTAVPAIVEMLCDAVGDDDTVAVADNGAVRNPMWLVAEAQCRRERVRHQLVATETEQLDFFMDLALYEGEEFDAATLKELAEISCPDAFAEGDQREKLLAPHGLIERTSNGRYRFRFDFLREYFQAEALARQWRDHKLEKLMSFLGNDQHSRGNSVLVQFLAQVIGPTTDWRAVVSAARSLAARNQGQVVLGGLWQLAAATLEGTAGTTKGDRRARLLELFADGSVEGRIQGVVFAGTIFGVDLGGITFSACRFIDCSFVNCDFDDRSTIERSSFMGSLRFTSCQGMKLLRLDPAGAHVSAEAREAWSEVAGRSLIDDATITHVLMDALKRFYRAGSFRAQEKHYLNRGVAGASRLKDAVWRALEENGVLEKHNVPGHGPDSGRNVTEAARQDVRKFLENGAPVGRVLGAIRAIKAELR